jgi:hypothetical protein
VDRAVVAVQVQRAERRDVDLGAALSIDGLIDISARNGPTATLACANSIVPITDAAELTEAIAATARAAGPRC